MNDFDAERQDRNILQADQEWDLLRKDSQQALEAILQQVAEHEQGFKVQKLAKTWFVLEHPAEPYKVQLIAEHRGANLDLSIHQPIGLNYRASPLTSVKLTKSNVSFAVQRILASYGLHDTAVSDELSSSNIETNNCVHRDFRSCQAYWDFVG